MTDLKKKEQADIDFYRDSEHESPEADSLGNLFNKMADCAVFFEAIQPYNNIFKKCSKALELGGGQGWASALVKKLYPHIEITLTDISSYAIESKGKWEKIFNTKIDHAYDCRSYCTKEEDESQDLVFCFASAHHFVKQKGSLEEIFRILKKGGSCLYLHEPSSSALFYGPAYKRVNKKRPVVEEDVLIHSRIRSIANDVGFECDIHFDASVTKRGPLEGLYYLTLGRLPFLQRILPCTADFLFTRP